ncbi:hypothetical protein LTR41_011590 [Exophiala xenobiotica]|nr:hypothetical protein LTR41_011590 [Exophiala xenobiotica]KAK5550730.1 hypothetical protein LTR46_011268 [Exophiala xenobiotica]
MEHSRIPSRYLAPHHNFDGFCCQNQPDHRGRKLQPLAQATLRDIERSHAAHAACNLNLSTSAIFLSDATTSFQVLNNVSNTIAVYNNGPDPTYTYLGIPLSGETVSRGYTATTFGLRTECKTASKQCKLNANSGASTPFQCTDAFYGDIEATADVMTSNDTFYGIQNPYYYAIGALFGTASTTNLEHETQIVTLVHGGVAFILSCAVTTYDIEYDSINGTVTRFVATPSNASVANIRQLPIIEANVVQSHLQTAALIAATTATNAQDLTDQYVLAYSKAALGAGALGGGNRTNLGRRIWL